MAGGSLRRRTGRGGGVGQVAADGGAAAQDGDLRVPGVAGDQGADARGHLLAVAEDVADEVPGDPVVDADGLVLPAAVAEPALGDSPQAGPAGQVQEDHRVGGLQADRQGGGVVPVDDPPGRGDQVALQGRERLLVQRLPVLVVVHGVEVDWRDAETVARATRARWDLPLPPQPMIAMRSIGTDTSGSRLGVRDDSLMRHGRASAGWSR